MKKILKNHNMPSMEITVNKNQVKVYDDENVYLESGTEFELYFNNPTWFNYKAEIFINDKRQKHSLVLGPFESFHLDRFMDEKRKMKVDVFEVDDVEETEKQRKNNGSIKVKFYKEIQKYNVTWTTNTWYSPEYYRNGTGTITSSGSAVYTSNASDMTLSMNSGTTRSMTKSFSPQNVAKTETARVESGKKSKQEFQKVDMDFESSAEVTYEYKILPISQKPVEEQVEILVKTNEIRNYCPDCGRRLKKGWVYCAGCGTKV